MALALDLRWTGDDVVRRAFEAAKNASKG